MHEQSAIEWQSPSFYILVHLHVTTNITILYLYCVIV